MKRILLFEIPALYREPMRVYGYLFGADKLEDCEKTIAVVGGMRGNEYTQIYEASQLVHQLMRLEVQRRIKPGKGILIIPTVNPASVNAEKRFWPTDNTDINRMFPGYDKGETTQRIAAALFNVLEGFEFGIHLTSHYISGNFVPHVSIQDTGRDYTELAKAFGLGYIRHRKPSFYDSTTLNYNWQIWNTKAFSLYGGDDKNVDREVSDTIVSSILNFMNRNGIVEFDHHRGYISSIVHDEDISVIKSKYSGFYTSEVKVGDFVHKEQTVAYIIDTGDGHVIEELLSPIEGVVFFIQSNPFAFANEQLMLIVK